MSNQPMTTDAVIRKIKTQAKTAFEEDSGNKHLVFLLYPYAKGQLQSLQSSVRDVFGDARQEVVGGGLLVTMQIGEAKEIGGDKIKQRLGLPALHAQTRAERYKKEYVLTFGYTEKPRTVLPTPWRRSSAHIPHVKTVKPPAPYTR